MSKKSKAAEGRATFERLQAESAKKRASRKTMRVDYISPANPDAMVEVTVAKRSRIIRYEQVSPKGNAEVDTSRLMFSMDGRMFLMAADEVAVPCTPEQVAAIDRHFGEDLSLNLFKALEMLAPQADTE